MIKVSLDRFVLLRVVLKDSKAVLVNVDLGQGRSVTPSERPPSVPIYLKYSVGPSIQSICTRCCFPITDMIQACSKFH